MYMLLTTEGGERKLGPNGNGRHRVYICYFDESGDTGISPIQRKHASYFILNCIIIQEVNWLDVLNCIVEWRRFLKNEYGISSRHELKGRDFRSGGGVFEGLNIPRVERMSIYRDTMTYQSTLPLMTFCVAVNKERAINNGWEPRYCAWNYALNRLHVMCIKSDDRSMVLPDEGHGYFIRYLIRRMRRFNSVPSHFGPEARRLRCERILEDPSDRKSSSSYFIQLTDLNAYACHRSKYVDPVSKMDRNLWDELASGVVDVRLLEINQNVGGWPPGIKMAP